MHVTTRASSKPSSSSWHLIVSNPLYIVIPDLFLVRPIRFLARCIFNCFMKPAKFLIVILTRNVWTKVRRNETICCLIGFGIGVGCCILYRLISNFLAPSSSVNNSLTTNNNKNSSSVILPLTKKKSDAKVSSMGHEQSSNGHHEISVVYKKRPLRSSTTTTTNKRTPEILNTTTNRCICRQYDNEDEFLTNLTSDREPLLGLPIDKYHDYVRRKHPTIGGNISDEMTWSEISSSLGTVGLTAGDLLHDSYHSNSITGDSGVDCHDMTTNVSTKSSRHHTRLTDTTVPVGGGGGDDYDDENESLMNYSTTVVHTILTGGPRKYDSDTALSRGASLNDTQSATESHVMSYMSTEKGLERALEQTSRFYADLEHIALDLGTLSRRYSASHTSIPHSISSTLSKYHHQHNRPVTNTIDALDWDWNDVHSPIIQSPTNSRRKQQQHLCSSSLPRPHSKNKVRRRLNTNLTQTDYHESDLEIRPSRSYDCTSSPLRRRPSSVYFDSTDNTSGDENLADETLQLPSSSSPSSVLTS